MEPLVEIIIVNYNGFEDTIECIKSLQCITYKNYLITVVDNASPMPPTDEQLEFLKSNSTYIESNTNLGFAGGNNYGIRMTSELEPDYYLLLNNDTIVCPDFLTKLVVVALKKKDAGIVCGKINWFDAQDRVWFGGGTYDPVTCSTRHSRFDEIDNDSRKYVKRIGFSTGCMQLIPRKVWMDTGPMEESLFLYAEDTDFCRKVYEKGYQIYYRNDARIYHKVSRSTGIDSDNTQYYIVRNELYIIKNYSTKKIIAYIVKLLRFAMDILKRRKRVKPVVNGIYDFCIGKYGKREG